MSTNGLYNTSSFATSLTAIPYENEYIYETLIGLLKHRLSLSLSSKSRYYHNDHVRVERAD